VFSKSCKMVRYDIFLSRQILNLFSIFFSFIVDFTTLHMNFRLLPSGVGSQRWVWNPVIFMRTRTFIRFIPGNELIKWPKILSFETSLEVNYVGALRRESSRIKIWRRLRNVTFVVLESDSICSHSVFWYHTIRLLLHFPPSDNKTQTPLSNEKNGPESLRFPFYFSSCNGLFSKPGGMVSQVLETEFS
jgi:hypothetical protein